MAGTSENPHQTCETPHTLELEELQRQLAEHLVFPALDPRSVRLVAGADTAYWIDGEGEHGACCVVVVDAETGEVVEAVSSSGAVAEDYVPGLLAFRELPLFLEAFSKLECTPDVVVFDGNGYLHPRHMGIASQASLEIGLPCFGVAKTFFDYGGEGFEMPEDRVGAFTDVVVAGEVCGRALRTSRGVKPVFVSAGGLIDLDSAVGLTMRLLSSESRVPIPTRLADIETKRLRKQLREG